MSNVVAEFTVEPNDTIETEFSLNVSNNDHNLLSNRDLADQHPISAITGLQDALDAKADTSDLATVATTGSYNDLTNKPTIPTVNNATLTIQKNSVSAGTFTANASSDTTINITVPTTASDVSALPSSTKYGASLSLTINSSTYVVTAQLKDQDGNNLGSAQTIDLPLESVVVNGSYDDQTKKIILTLQSGSTIEFSVADLVAGLQSEITSENMLDADLVDDSTSINKFVTSSDKTTWNGKQDTLVSGTNIKTLKNLSLLGNGDIGVNGGTDISVTTGSGEGYIALDYIQATGTQYIDSGIIPNTFDYEIETEFAFDSVNGSNTPFCAWGFMASDATLPRWLLASYQSKYLLNVNTTTAVGSQDTLKHTFNGEVYLNSGNAPRWNCSIDGTVLIDDQVVASESTFLSNTMPIYMFARNNSGTAGNFVSGKLYKHTVKKAGVKIQELIPAKRTSDNAIGLYDTVTATFFTNDGTGTFTAGSETGVIGNLSGLTISFTNDSGYVTSSYHDSTKQDALVSGTNIKTINSASLLGSGNIDTKQIFDVTWQTTTFDEISAALAAGKFPVCYYNKKVYYYELTSGNVHYFVCTYYPYLYKLRFYKTSPYYATHVEASEMTSNKVTSISSSSTDTQYPSAKCVYDIVGDIETTLNAIRGV